jgi:hypothetical protein
MAWRIAGQPSTRQPRWQRTVGLLVAIAALALVAIATLIVAGSRPPAGPLTNGPLVVANALGWRGTDSASGAAIQLEPCDGLCEEAMDLRLSADGRTVFFVDPSHDGGDLHSDQPGWAIWRWDRLEGTVHRIVGCDGLECTLRRPIPSPDGRYLAYGQGWAAPTIPMPAVDELVVVDAETGREVRRYPDLAADGWWAPYPNFAWEADGQLLVTTLGPEEIRYRRIDVTTGAEADVSLSRDGLLESSPDGTTVLVADTGPDGVVRVWSLDDRFEQTRVLWEGEPWRPGTWSPDGTKIAGQTMSEGPAQALSWTTHVIDIGTGTRMTYIDDVVTGDLLWLPAD